MKERELKVLKFKTLFESPTTRDKKEGHGGSFIGAKSARAAYLGRTLTKTSEDLNKLPLLEGEEGRHTRNGTIKGDNTLKHGGIRSHFSSGLMLDGDIDSTQPRRKTVGFKNREDKESIVTGEESKNGHTDARI